MDKYYVSKERLEELKRELEHLKTVRRIEVAEHLRRAKEYGDLSENAEYTEAREEQSRVELRIAELDGLVRRAVIIKKAEGSDVITIGSRVSVMRDAKMYQYVIVGSGESKPEEGKISNESPIGSALLGKKVGDSVTIKTPGGDIHSYQITKVE